MERVFEAFGLWYNIAACCIGSFGRAAPSMSRSFWLLLSAAYGATSKFSCLDESGDAVDHFYVLKGNAGSDAYLLLDGDDAFRAANSFDSSSNAVVRTLKQIYGTLPSSHAFTLYNDETDEGTKSETRGHSKGAVLFDGDQGFWLIHSLPRYPDRRSKGYGGLPDTTYGQSFVCLTLDTSKLEDVGAQLMLHWPQHYDSSVSDDLAAAAPSFNATLADVKSTAKSSTKTFSTVGARAGNARAGEPVAPRSLASTPFRLDGSFVSRRGLFREYRVATSRRRCLVRSTRASSRTTRSRPRATASSTRTSSRRTSAPSASSPG